MYVDGSTSNPLQTAFRKLRMDVGIEKVGVGHYAFRHMFETIAGDCEPIDQPAIDYVMGHTPKSIDAVYREGINPKRVIRVCKHVRRWFVAKNDRKAVAK